MARATITIPDALYRRLTRIAASRETTVDRLIVESLQDLDAGRRIEAEGLIADAQARSSLGATEATSLAVEEVRAERARR